MFDLWFKKAQSRKAVVVMYTRSGCSLCDTAWKLLEDLARRYPLSLKTVDIAVDEELTRRFGERIPVIEVNGEERMWGRINAMMLERLLKAQTRAR
jgi:glutaredoxin